MPWSIQMSYVIPSDLPGHPPSPCVPCSPKQIPPFHCPVLRRRIPCPLQQGQIQCLQRRHLHPRHQISHKRSLLYLPPHPHVTCTLRITKLLWHDNKGGFIAITAPRYIQPCRLDLEKSHQRRVIHLVAWTHVWACAQTSPQMSYHRKGTSQANETKCPVHKNCGSLPSTASSSH